MLPTGARPQRRVRAVITAGGLGLLVCIWQLATASPGPRPAESSAGEGSASLAGGGSGDSALPPTLPLSSDARGVPSSQAPQTVLHPRRAAPTPAALHTSPEDGARSSSGVPLTPPGTEPDSQPDGLPASGMRCTKEGDVLHCGSCRTDGDCPPGQGCVANRRTRRFECMASDCEEDAHCFPGSLCRAVNTGATGTVIRRCSPEGLRRAGEPCDLTPISPTGSCQEGLVCVRGLCGARCRLDEPSSCPAGHVCLDSRDGPGCLPDCQVLGCPEGQRCKRLSDGASHQCLQSVQGQCPEEPCAEGERCNMRLLGGRGVFWCARRCNPLHPGSCPAEQVCGVGSATLSTCYRRCEPTEPDSCGEGWVCASVSEDMTLWGCRPDARE